MLSSFVASFAKISIRLLSSIPPPSFSSTFPPSILLTLTTFLLEEEKEATQNLEVEALEAETGFYFFVYNIGLPLQAEERIEINQEDLLPTLQFQSPDPVLAQNPRK